MSNEVESRATVEARDVTATTRRIGLVGCVKQKPRKPALAKDLYTSTLFEGRRRYVEQSCDDWWILEREVRAECIPRTWSSRTTSP